MDVKQILAKLDRVKPNGQNQWSAACPAHDDGKTASLSISTGKDNKILLHCHAGCKYEDIAAALGIEKKSNKKTTKTTKRKAGAKKTSSKKSDSDSDSGAAAAKPKIKETYNYTDETGKLLYQGVRMDPKDFRQRAPNGKGGWTWSVKGVTLVPYNLPAVLKAHEVYIVEGEKDVASLAKLGLTGTCNVGGAGKWQDNYSQRLTGKDVVILPDNDKPGQDHALVVADSLCGVAGSVKILTLPGLPPKGDLTDWVAAGGTAAQLQAMAKQADVYVPKVVILPDEHADTIAREFEKRSQYKHHWHQNDLWTMYCGSQYQEIDENGQLMKYVSDFMNKCVMADGKKGIQRVVVNKSKLTDVVLQLRFLDSVYLRPKQVAPCSLDGSLDTRFTLAVKNGLLDWSKHPYRLVPNNPQYYNLNYLPYEYKAKSKCDLWDKYLVETTCGDYALEELLQMFAGYCLMKHDQQKQKFLICYGETRTGKGVFSGILSRLLGNDNVSAVPLARFAEPHFLAGTYGKMLNICDETDKHLEKQIESQLKTYTGGGKVTFKEIYKGPRDEYPTAKIIVTTNHLPAFKDTSDAMWRRILICPFNNEVAEKDVIGDLVEQIVANEMPGVLRWALDGARKVVKQGDIKNPVASEKVLGDYRSESLPEIIFLRDNFEACDPTDRSLNVPAKVFRAAYNEWCSVEGIKAKSLLVLQNTVEKVFPKVCYTNIKFPGNQRVTQMKCWVGMTIRQNSEYIKHWDEPT